MFFYKHIKLNLYANRIAIIILNLLVFIIHNFKSPFNNQPESSNVVIIAVHRLGDSIFTLPAIKNIIHHHKSNIYLFCLSETIPIYNQVLKAINYCELFKNDFFIQNKIARGSIRKKLRELKPNIIYDLTGNVTSASILIRSKAKQIIGINDPYYRSIYTKHIVIRKDPHLIDTYLDAIRQVVPIKDFSTNIPNTFEQGEYILIHPFASYKAKEWGLKNFIKLLEVINQKSNCIFVSQPQKIPEDIFEYLKEKHIIVKETKSVDELIEVIKKCILFIGNDSGPVHIANLLGKPTFTIYGPTNPDFHKPLTGINEYAIKQLKCTAGKQEKICFTHGGVFCPTHDCMSNLRFEEIKNRVLSFIQKNTVKNI